MESIHIFCHALTVYAEKCDENVVRRNRYFRKIAGFPAKKSCRMIDNANPRQPSVPAVCLSSYAYYLQNMMSTVKFPPSVEMRRSPSYFSTVRRMLYMPNPCAARSSLVVLGRPSRLNATCPL